MSCIAVFSPGQLEGMTGGRGLGGACDHIKAFVLSLSRHQRKVYTEGLYGRHVLGILGRTLYSAVLLF